MNLLRPSRCNRFCAIKKNALNPGDYKGSPPLSHFLAHRFLRCRENRLAYHFRLAIQTPSSFCSETRKSCRACEHFLPAHERLEQTQDCCTQQGSARFEAPGYGMLILMKKLATIGCDVSINNQQSTIEIAFAAGHDE